MGFIPTQVGLGKYSKGLFSVVVLELDIVVVDLYVYPLYSTIEFGTGRVGNGFNSTQVGNGESGLGYSSIHVGADGSR